MKVEHLVPEIYYSDSRDFAFVARCFEVIFNYMKTGAQCVNVNYLTDAIDSNIIELMADTVGFTVKHKYTSSDLLAIAGSFQKLLRNKGSIYSIELAVLILMNNQQIRDRNNIGSICEIDEDDPFHLIINIPENLNDIVLLEDVFSYLLPAGMTYSIKKTGANIDPLRSKLVAINEAEVEIVSENNNIIRISADTEANKHLQLNTAQITKKPKDLS